MELVRNFISVSGLINESEIPDKNTGQIIQYSETETIFIPENQPEVKSIFQIIIKPEIKSIRKIKVSESYTIILDGIKRLKIIYSENDNSDKVNFLELELPYNTFFEIPESIGIKNIEVHVLDAYFSLIDKRKMYSYFLFMINISLYSPLPQLGLNKEPTVSFERHVIENNLVEDILNNPNELDFGLDSEYL